MSERTPVDLDAVDKMMARLASSELLPDNEYALLCQLRSEVITIRAAVVVERVEWHKLVALMMKSLPWGALKGALLEDSRVKEAMRHGTPGGAPSSSETEGESE